MASTSRLLVAHTTLQQQRRSLDARETRIIVKFAHKICHLACVDAFVRVCVGVHVCMHVIMRVLCVYAQVRSHLMRIAVRLRCALESKSPPHNRGVVANLRRKLQYQLLSCTFGATQKPAACNPHGQTNTHTHSASLW